MNHANPDSVIRPKPHLDKMPVPIFAQTAFIRSKAMPISQKISLITRGIQILVDNSAIGFKSFYLVESNDLASNFSHV